MEKESVQSTKTGKIEQKVTLLTAYLFIISIVREV